MTKTKLTLEQVQEMVKEVMNMFNLERMPKSSEVRSSNISGLDGYISKFGGYGKVAQTMNLDLSTKKRIFDRRSN